MAVLQGARQTGKTTLCTSPWIGTGRTYYNLDDLQTLEIARNDPRSLWESSPQVTLDEIQHAPELLAAVKLAVDQDRRPGRFILTGSANLLFMRQVSESLAGRAVYLKLPTLTWAEVERVPAGATIQALMTAERLEDAWSVVRDAVAHPRRPLHDAMLHGGYPEPALTFRDESRSLWCRGYLTSYLERDLREVAAVEDVISVRKMMQWIAANPGWLANVAGLAREIGISENTARRYLGHLETTFQILSVPPFFRNRGKRVVKARKIYWSDTGLGTYLAGIHDTATLAREQGRWLESWIAIHLAAWCDLQVPPVQLHHWRTSAGREVDFVLERGRTLLPIEVKSSRQILSRDLLGLESFLALHPEAPFGVVACQCDAPTQLRSNILALPIASLLLT